jgi:hypothetical protein
MRRATEPIVKRKLVRVQRKLSQPDVTGVTLRKNVWVKSKKLRNPGAIPRTVVGKNRFVVVLKSSPGIEKGD